MLIKLTTIFFVLYSLFCTLLLSQVHKCAISFDSVNSQSSHLTKNDYLIYHFNRFANSQAVLATFPGLIVNAENAGFLTADTHSFS